MTLFTVVCDDLPLPFKCQVVGGSIVSLDLDSLSPKVQGDLPCPLRQEAHLASWCCAMALGEVPVPR